MQQWIVRASRVALTAVIVAVSLYNFDVNLNNNYSPNDNKLSKLLHHRSGGLIQTIQCDVVNNLPKGWCLDIDLIPRYIDNKIVTNSSTVPADESTASFQLQRYTIKGFEQCLENKTVVFIGDSRTRFQYMHLGLSLKMGRFMFCPDIQQGATFHEQEYDVECLGIAPFDRKVKGGNQNDTTWNHVFKHSTKILSSSSSNNNNQSTTTTNAIEIGKQDSLCDCYRPRRRSDFGNFYENRYTKRTTEFGQINIIHLENIQDRVSMNEDYPPYQPFYSTSSKRCKPGECGRLSSGHGDVKDKWVGNLNASLYDIIPLLNATHVFANPGWDWGGDISCMLRAFANHHRKKIKVAYLSHPLDISGTHKMLDPREMKCHDVDAIDRTSMTLNVPSAWYVDNLHVWSILNEEFNHQMMKMICPIE